MNVMIKAEQGSTVNVNDIHDVGTVNVGCRVPESRPQWKAGNQRERMDDVIGDLIAEGLFREKQDFAALYRIIAERALASFTLQEFADYLCQNFSIPEELRPAENNLKRVVFGDERFPKWKLPFVKDSMRRSRLVRIATLFLEGMGLPMEP